MTWILNVGTVPSIEIKTWGILIGGKDVVFLGGQSIPVKKFLLAAYYVLTGTDLYSNDPRLQFVECVKSMQKVQGWNKDEAERLESNVSPIKSGNMENGDDVVIFKNYRISIGDFLFAVHYVLTNTDLYLNDPRLQFVEHVKQMQQIQGCDEKAKRLASDLPMMEFSKKFKGRLPIRAKRAEA